MARIEQEQQDAQRREEEAARMRREEAERIRNMRLEAERLQQEAQNQNTPPSTNQPTE